MRSVTLPVPAPPVTGDQSGQPVLSRHVGLSLLSLHVLGGSVGLLGHHQGHEGQQDDDRVHGDVVGVKVR